MIDDDDGDDPQFVDISQTTQSASAIIVNEESGRLLRRRMKM